MLNCLYCNVMCYEECYEKCCIFDDNDMKRCLVMDNKGNCRICFEKCVWINYRIILYVFKYVIEKVIKMYFEMEKKYKEVKG